MKRKTKNIFKKIALGLVGVLGFGAVVAGVSTLIGWVKNDSYKISPSFVVGSIGTDGKYVKSDLTLYTEDAFRCDGLEVKLDFENEISYQVFFYDDLDNFIDKTEVLTDSYASVNKDGYARIVIIPTTTDEDGKLDYFEKTKFVNQMEIRVNKKQTTEYATIFGNRMRVLENKNDLRFKLGTFVLSDNGEYVFTENSQRSITYSDILAVKDISKITVNYNNETNNTHGAISLFQFELKDGKFSLIDRSITKFDISLKENTTHVLIEFSIWPVDSSSNPLNIDSSMLSKIPDYITFS